MYFRFLFALAFVLCLSGGVRAQNTATPVVTGYLSMSGCASPALTPCFVQYGAGGGGGGGSVTQGTTPWVDDITQWANVALGAPSNYGTSPGAVVVPGVNAFVTNPVAVTGTFFQTTQPVSLAANQSINLAQINATSTALLMVAPSTAPVTATNPALTVDLRPDSPGIIALGPATIANSVPVIPSSQYPGNATAAAVPVTATATGTTAATVATIPAVAGKTAYICGFTITADATALAVGTAVVSGTISGSLSYLQGIFAVTSGASDLTKTFNPCIPASAANTAIVVTSAAAGTGGNTIVNVQGYYL